jgi:hypothetical protein
MFELWCAEILDAVAEDMYETPYEELDLDRRIWVLDNTCDALAELYPTQELQAL